MPLRKGPFAVLDVFVSPDNTIKSSFLADDFDRVYGCLMHYLSGQCQVSVRNDRHDKLVPCDQRGGAVFYGNHKSIEDRKLNHTSGIFLDGDVERKVIILS